MYVILVYDIEEKRVTRVLKACRRYLHWVQNSVFEGDISEGKLKELYAVLKKIIKKESDSVMVYKMRSDSVFQKEILGQEKAPTDTFL